MQSFNSIFILQMLKKQPPGGRFGLFTTRRIQLLLALELKAKQHRQVLHQATAFSTS